MLPNGDGQNIDDPLFKTYSSDSQIEEMCVLVKNLDQNQNDSMTVSKKNYTILEGSVNCTQIWEGYWDQRQKFKQTLFRAVVQQDSKGLKQLMKTQIINLNQYQYLDGWTLLHHACSLKNEQIVKILLDNGCDPNLQTFSMKYTPLHLAVQQKNSTIIQILLNEGADPNIQDIDFKTSMHDVVEYCHKDLLDIFISYPNVNFLSQNKFGMTTLDCCRCCQMKGMIRKYIKLNFYEVRNRPYLTRLIPLKKGRFYIVSSRFDDVQKILYQSPQNNKQNKQTQNIEDETQKSITKKLKVQKGLGKKISLSFLKKLNALADASIFCYQQQMYVGECEVEQLSQYDILRKLGTGSFGEVFLVRKKHSTKLFALKRMRKKDIFDKKMKKYVMAERSILKNIRYPFTVHGHSFFQNDKYIFMVMQFCAGGDMENVVRSTRLQQSQIRKYCCEVVLALQELHSKQYLFRDLKASNVLIDQHGHIKMSDFGLAKQSQLSCSFLGSFAYLAPQMLVETDNKPHTAAIDWYLLGVFVYQMITGYPPFYCTNKTSMLQQIKNAKPVIPSHISKSLKNFLEKTLTKNPDIRLGAKGSQQIKSHEWFQTVDWKKVKSKQIEMTRPSIDWKQLRNRTYIQPEQPENNEEYPLIYGWDYCEKIRQ